MAHTWQFFRAGGVDQVAILSGADIAHLDQLDQKLWVALACPTRGIDFDARTLDLIDTDGDGRIRPPELIAACQWACAQLRDPDELIRGGDTLALDAIDASQSAGAAILAEARRILELRSAEAQAPDAADAPDAALAPVAPPTASAAPVIGLADVLEHSALIAAMRFNGDGVIVPLTSDDERIQQVIQSIMDTQGSVKDLSGAQGVERARAEAFFAAVAALHDWQVRGAGDATLAPLGERTSAALEALNAVREKIDDFFARCRLAAYDARAVEELNPSQERYRDLAAQVLSLHSSAIAELPLAPIEPQRTLPLLGAGVNPAWAQALAEFSAAAFVPLCADAGASLSEAQWLALQARLAPYRDWLASRPASSVETLTLAQIEQIAHSDAQAVVLDLIEQDLAAAPHNAGIVELERLLRYKRDLLRLLGNFVSFKAFYRREGATFEAGTLYLDGRSCDLTIQVGDLARHAALAGMAKACLAYCECRRGADKMTIVAAFTAGDTDFLFVGRNGIFYDRAGHDWDATIVKMIDNPTNVRQAFFSPYKKLIRALEEQVAKRAAASDASVQGSLTTAAGGLVAGGAAGAPAAPAAKAPGKIDVGTVAALGVALGSISAVVVGLFGKFVDLGWWLPVGVLGILLAISCPSMAIAWFKLHERSLGPILDASGWAINGRMKVNVRLGRLISQMAHIPLSAKHTLKDPYADRNPGRYVAAAVAVLLLAWCGWRLGWVDTVLPVRLRYAPVMASLAARIEPKAALATSAASAPAPAASQP
jgi:hypothetical protein